MKKILFLLISFFIISCNKNIEENTNQENLNIKYKYVVVYLTVLDKDIENMKKLFPEIEKRDAIEYYVSDVMEIAPPITEDQKFRLMDFKEKEILWENKKKNLIVIEKNIGIFDSYAEASKNR